MSFSASDFRRFHSEFVTNQAGNGGRMSRRDISPAKHGFFPRVTKRQRDAGDVILRKLFLANVHSGDEAAAGALVYLEAPSRGEDAFLLAKGTMRDVQLDVDGSQPTTTPDWVGVGSLHVALNGGETEVQVAMEQADAEFLNGGLLHLSGKFKVDQTAAAEARPGDSVQYDDVSEQWEVTTRVDEVGHPWGVWLGDGRVLTDDGAPEEWLRLPENLHTAEQLGTGDGAAANPALTALAHAAKGVCGQRGKRPVVTTTCGGATRETLIQRDGSCTGYCAAGQLDMATGQWTTPITWTTAPDAGAAITITYRENCYTYAGNVATVALAEQVAGAYPTATTHVGGVIEGGDIEPVVSNFDASDTVAGVFDEVTHPITLGNLGAVEDDWTIAFTSATAFTLSGAVSGQVGVGSVSEDFAPLNPATQTPFCVIPAAAWSGVWAPGDTVAFTTSPAALPLWFKEIVPAGCAQEPWNLLTWGYWID